MAMVQRPSRFIMLSLCHSCEPAWSSFLTLMMANSRKRLVQTFKFFPNLLALYIEHILLREYYGQFLLCFRLISLYVINICMYKPDQNPE